MTYSIIVEIVVVNRKTEKRKKIIIYDIKTLILKVKFSSGWLV